MEIKPPTDLKIGKQERLPRNEITRRELFQKATEGTVGAAATLLALKTGRASQAWGKIERLAEYLDPQEPFAPKWELAISKGVSELEQNQEFIQKFGQEKVTELARILREFDINQYLNSLASLANIETQDINGELLSFTVKIRKQGNQMAHVEDKRHIVLFIDDWALYKNNFHKETIWAILSHELAHIWSFNHNDPAKYETPWLKSGDWPIGYVTGVLKHFYEGATEFVAIAPQLQQGKSKTLEQGYRGGGTLAAFTIAELIGRNNFIKAYLTRDLKLLIETMEGKIGKRASENLLLPSADSFFSNLDELHKIFYSQTKYQYTQRPQEIIDRAWELGIKEKAQHLAFNGFTITTHLYLINDADALPQFVFHAVAACPKIYRTGKIKDFHGRYHLHQLLFYMNSRLPISDAPARMKQTIADLQTMTNATSNTYFDRNPQLYIEVPEIIKENLEQLNKIADPYSNEFTSLWNTINREAQGFISDLGMKILEEAKVADLIVKENMDQGKVE